MATALTIVRQFFPKVNKVKDAPRTLEIEVTDRDNKDSRVRDHNGCAMAVACKRKFKLDGVIVSIDRAYLIKGDTAVRYKIPSSVQREIVSFDREAGFRTGNYHLSAIAKSNELGTQRGESTSNEKSHSGKLKSRFHHITDGIRAALGSKHAPAGITHTEGE